MEVNTEIEKRKEMERGRSNAERSSRKEEKEKCVPRRGYRGQYKPTEMETKGGAMRRESAMRGFEV